MITRYIYNKFMFLINKTEYKMLISYLNLLTFDIFTLCIYVFSYLLSVL